MSVRPTYRLWHELRDPDAPRIFAVPGRGRRGPAQYTSARLRHLNPPIGGWDDGPDGDDGEPLPLFGA